MWSDLASASLGSPLLHEDKLPGLGAGGQVVGRLRQEGKLALLQEVKLCQNFWVDSTPWSQSKLPSQRLNQVGGHVNPVLLASVLTHVTVTVPFGILEVKLNCPMCFLWVLTLVVPFSPLVVTDVSSPALD